MAAVDDLRDRPIRVVVFGSGPVPTHEFRRFLARLEAEPRIEVAAAIREARGASVAAVFGDLRKRRGVLAVPLFLAWAGGEIGRVLRHPRRERALRRTLSAMRDRVRVVPDVHAPGVVADVVALAPDLGLIYGSPILRPELFEAPRLGTLGIHHGKVPEYRGNKTAFWAMLNGERSAGVTIQKVEAGLDKGAIVAEGAVEIGRRSRGAVWRDLENLGLALYLDAILKVRAGEANFRPQSGTRGKLYRNPKPRDLARFWLLRLRTRLGLASRVGGAEGGGASRARVLIFTETFHPVVGGGETQARLLAEGLLARGHAVRVLTRRSDADLPRAERLGDLVVHRIAPAGRGQLKKWGLVPTGVAALWRLRREYDAVFVSGFRIVGIGAVPVARLLGKRIVLKADSQGEMSGAFFEGGLARIGATPASAPFRAFLRLRNRVLRRADAFVAITGDVAAELDAAGVPAARVHRVANGVDVSRFAPGDPEDRPALRARLGLPGDAWVATYTGRLVSYKGLPALVRVWEDLRRGDPRAFLVLVGTGGLDIHACEDDLRAFVRERDLGAAVRFAGAVGNVPDYLRASDAYVFPTENDAFPCALVEAMATGLPVVTTPVGAIPEIVEDGRTGLFVPPRDPGALRAALERLRGDPALAADLGTAAARSVRERYAAEAVTARVAALLEPPHDGR